MPGIASFPHQPRAVEPSKMPTPKPINADGPWIEMQEITKTEIVNTYKGFFNALPRVSQSTSTETLELGKDHSLTQVCHENLLLSGLNKFDKSLLQSAHFWEVVGSDVDIPKMFGKLMGRNANADDIQAWVKSNPYLSQQARWFMMVLLLSYEAEMAKQVALAPKASRASLEAQWVGTQRFAAKLMGLSDRDEEMTSIMCVELFRDRVLKGLRAHLLEDVGAAHALLVSTAKDTLMSYAQAKDTLLSELKAMDLANLKPLERDRILSLNERVLNDTRHQIANETLARLHETGFCGSVDSELAHRKLMAMRGLYVGHYLSDYELRQLKKMLADDAGAQRALGLGVWGELERADIKKAILARSSDAARPELRCLGRYIFRLHAPV